MPIKHLTPLLVAVLLAPSSACKSKQAAPGQTAAPSETVGQGQQEATTDADLEGREVVPNWLAQTGDVTICPLTGRKFEVEEQFDRFDYKGHSFVFCCANCIDEVKENPGKYLDPLVEQAGGPAEGEADADAATDVESEPGLETESDPGLQGEGDGDTATDVESDPGLETESDPGVER